MDDLLTGVVLAAGAGRRMGQPKVLLRDAAGQWLVRLTVRALLEGGCDNVLVVLGAAAEQGAEILSDMETGGRLLRCVYASDWDQGQSVSLRAALDAAESLPAEALLLTLTDLPDVDGRVAARVAAFRGPDALARAVYGGRPGHPVLLGRHHWSGIAQQTKGDSGAREYLRSAHLVEVECGDLATGADLDDLEDVSRWTGPAS